MLMAVEMMVMIMAVVMTVDDDGGGLDGDDDNDENLYVNVQINNEDIFQKSDQNYIYMKLTR